MLSFGIRQSFQHRPTIWMKVIGAIPVSGSQGAIVVTSLPNMTLLRMCFGMNMRMAGENGNVPFLALADSTTSSGCSVGEMTTAFIRRSELHEYLQSEGMTPVENVGVSLAGQEIIWFPIEDWSLKKMHPLLEQKMEGDVPNILYPKPFMVGEASYDRGCRNMSCPRVSASQKCASCGALYCSRECQKDDWSSHKAVCKAKSVKTLLNSKSFRTRGAMGLYGQFVFNHTVEKPRNSLWMTFDLHDSFIQLLQTGCSLAVSMPLMLSEPKLTVTDKMCPQIFYNRGMIEKITTISRSMASVPEQKLVGSVSVSPGTVIWNNSDLKARLLQDINLGEFSCYTLCLSSGPMEQKDDKESHHPNKSSPSKERNQLASNSSVQNTIKHTGTELDTKSMIECLSRVSAGLCGPNLSECHYMNLVVHKGLVQLLQSYFGVYSLAEWIDDGPLQTHSERKYVTPEYRETRVLNGEKALYRNVMNLDNVQTLLTAITSLSDPKLNAEERSVIWCQLTGVRLKESLLLRPINTCWSRMLL